MSKAVSFSLSDNIFLKTTNVYNCKNVILIYKENIVVDLCAGVWLYYTIARRIVY